MRYKLIPVTAWYFTLSILTLTVFVSAAADSSLAEIAIVLASLCAVIAVPRTPAISALTMVCITVAISLFNDLGTIITPVSIGIVAGVLGYKGYPRWGIAYALVILAFATIDLENKKIVFEALMGSALLAIFLFAPLVGGYIHGTRERNHEAERVRFEAALQRHRRATIHSLHDSVASTLTSSILRAESLALEPDISPNIKENIQFISQENRKAITQIRELIQVLHSENIECTSLQVDTTFEEQLSEFETLLRSHNFNVETANGELSREVIASVPVLTMPVMRELAANIIKYGVSGSRVYVDITVSEKSLFVEVRSTIGAAQSPTYLSTGLGLKEIQKEMKLHDGEFTWGSQGNEWFSHWAIPRKEKSRGAHKSERKYRL